MNVDGAKEQVLDIFKIKFTFDALEFYYTARANVMRCKDGKCKAMINIILTQEDRNFYFFFVILFVTVYIV